MTAEVCTLLLRHGIRASILLIFDENSVLLETEFMLRECLSRFSELRFVPVFLWVAPRWVDTDGAIDAPDDLEELALDFQFNEQFGMHLRADDQL